MWKQRRNWHMRTCHTNSSAQCNWWLAIFGHKSSVEQQFSVLTINWRHQQQPVWQKTSFGKQQKMWKSWLNTYHNWQLKTSTGNWQTDWKVNNSKLTSVSMFISSIDLKIKVFSYCFNDHWKLWVPSGQSYQCAVKWMCRHRATKKNAD